MSRSSQSSPAAADAQVAGRRITVAAELPLAAGMALGLLAMVEVAIRADGGPWDVLTAMLLGLAATTSLALARGQVLAAAWAIVAATLLTLAIGQRPPIAVLVALVSVLYLVGRRRSARVAVAIVAPFVLLAVVAPYLQRLVESARIGALYPVLLAAVAASAVGLGRVRQVRRAVAESDLAQQLVADSMLEHVARGERARIARELHDVVAHHISKIAVQAEAARLATPGMPAEGAERLVAIGDSARAALTEMRRLLGVLRDDADTGAPSRRPQPGLPELNELIDDARDAGGGSTRLIVRGSVGPLDPGVELTAYRIVQEALTNVRRHAPGAAVDVELRYAADALHVRVRDNGPGPPDAAAGGSTAAGTSGHGLLGMRERAATVGGELRAGPAPVGGFLVEADLPTVVPTTASSLPAERAS